MKLVYFSHSRIPSREANSLHVIFMASAFAQMGFDVTLVSWPVGNRLNLVLMNYLRNMVLPQDNP